MSLDPEKVEKKFKLSQDALVLQQSDLSLSSVSDMVDAKAIELGPRYQRRERWTLEKESELIESFILNIPVPPIYLAEDNYGTYSVIDGKQRITTINKFLRGEFKLTNLEKFKELEACKFNDLPKSIQSALKIRPYLRVVTLLKQSDPDLKYEVFLRLNKAGVALNSQEIRNVAFRGKFNDALFALSEIPYFNKVMKASKTSKIYREMQDVQYVLRFFTVREFWHSFQGNMDKAMDDFMRLHVNDSAAQVSAQKHGFIATIQAVEQIWGDDAFQKPGSSRVLQGFFDVQTVCLSLLPKSQLARVTENATKTRAALKALLNEDETFVESATQFTSNPKNMHYRISTFLEKLKQIK